jgi:hypothetical protein
MNEHQCAAILRRRGDGYKPHRCGRTRGTFRVNGTSLYACTAPGHGSYVKRNAAVLLDDTSEQLLAYQADGR